MTSGDAAVRRRRGIGLPRPAATRTVEPRTTIPSPASAAGSSAPSGAPLRRGVDSAPDRRLLAALGRPVRGLRLELEVRDALLQASTVSRLPLRWRVSMNVRISAAKRSRIAAAHRQLASGCPSCRSSLPNRPPAALLLHVRGRRGQLRNGVGLDVLRAGQRAQIGDELLLVARRQQRGEQDDVGNAGAERRDRGVARIDEDEIGADLLADDPLEDGGLAVIRFDCEDERQGLRPHHEDEEHAADHGEDHDAVRCRCSGTRARRRRRCPKSIARLSRVMPSPPQTERELVAHARVDGNDGRRRAARTRRATTEIGVVS